MTREKLLMDFDDRQEAIQHTMTIAEDMNGHQQSNSSALTAQQAELVFPEHIRKSYATDLTDAQWQRIAPLLPPIKSNGHRHHIDLREVVNGILYVVCDSHNWGSFPHDLPPKGTVYSYFRRYQLDGTLKQILDALCSEDWEAVVDKETPDAPSGNRVSGEPVPESCVPESEDIHDATPLTDAHGNQAVSKALLSTSYELSVVIPTRNEHDNIWPLLETLHNALCGLHVEVIFVDDSDDDTPLIIKNASVTMETPMFHVHVEHRQPGTARAGGLATAVVHGMNRAQAAYVAVLDADLQHPPEQLRVFYDKAVEQNVDLVLASRYIKGGSYEGLAGIGRRCISVGMKWTAKLLFPGQLLRISDPLGGFFLLRRSLLAGVSLHPIGYKILLEILIRCRWRHVLEVPYHFQARAAGHSKATVQQGILALRHMLRLWREVPAAGRVWKIGILLLLNVVIALTLFLVHKSFPWVGAALSMVILGVMACLDFILFNRLLFPSPNKAPLQGITIPTTPIIDDDTDVQFEAMRYAEWLTAEAKRNNNGSHQEEGKKYAEDALRTITVKSQEFRPFAPFRYALSAFKTLTRRQAVVLSTIMLGCGLGLLFYGMKLGTVSLTVLLISLVFFAQSVFSLYLMLYSWEYPERLQSSRGPCSLLPPQLSFTVLLPARHEEAVIYETIKRVWAANYPSDLLEIVVICHSDDTGTIAEAQRAIREIGSSRVRVETFCAPPINKPHGLNVGFQRTSNQVVTIFDAEDDMDHDIFNVINTVMLEEKAGIVQAGVQLMNFRDHWFAIHNCMEYFFWFKSRLHFHAKVGMIPLGGNTVFFRRDLIERSGGWDEHCLTEDADIGLRLSGLGEAIRVIYDRQHTTREETPPTVASFIRQRTRWQQGFLQVLRKGSWLTLPRLSQRLLAVFTLSYPFLQALLTLLWLPAIIAVLWLKLPVLVVLISFLPLYALFLQFLVTVVGAFTFTREYGFAFPLFTLISMTITFLPYQFLLGISAVRAIYRELLRMHNWEKTEHAGAHRKPEIVSFNGQRALEAETTVPERAIR